MDHIKHPTIEHAYSYEGVLIVLEGTQLRPSLTPTVHITLHDGTYVAEPFAIESGVLPVQDALVRARDRADALLEAGDLRPSFKTEHLELQHQFMHGAVTLGERYED